MDRLLDSRRSLALALAGLGLIALGACNTAEGVGEDVENVGEEIQEEADY